MNKQGLIFYLKCNGQPSRAGVLSLLPRQRQQAFRRDTLVRHHAEESARRHAGIVRQHLEMPTGRKAFPALPGIDRGNRNAQVRGNLLQRDVFLEPPVTERGRKAGADVAAETRPLRHHESLPEAPVARKGIRDGDILLTVNQRPAGDYDIEDLRDLLQSQDGKEITVTYIRGDTTKATTFKLRRKI